MHTFIILMDDKTVINTVTRALTFIPRKGEFVVYRNKEYLVKTVRWEFGKEDAFVEIRAGKI